MNAQIHVLLIEDNLGDANLIHKTLHRSTSGNYQVTHVQRIRGCLEGVDELDVAILDLSLPESSGIETLRRAQKELPDIPIIVLTGLDDYRIAVAAVREGAQDYCVKGAIDGDQLPRIIQYAIERKHFEEIKDRIHHSNRLASIGHLAAGVAHEINNPAAFLLTNLTMLKSHLRSVETLIENVHKATHSLCTTDKESVESLLNKEEIPELLQEMNEMLDDNLEGVDRIRTVTKELKYFSHIETNRAEIVQFNDVVESACSMAFNEIRHRARFIKDFKYLPEIVADRDKLLQTVFSLLINSAQAIETGSADTNTISVSTSYSNQKLIFRIEDTGRGISKEDLPKVFEPFFATKAWRIGTGLGLSLSAETARNHGGKITVRSTIGKGSSFELSLPEDTGLTASAPNAVMPMIPSPAIRDKTRILLIDDEEMLRRSFRRMLESAHDIVEADGGKMALQILATDTDFDLILCDIMMPEIDGPMFYEELKNVSYDLQPRVIFISGGAFTARTQQFVQDTHARLLDKPISPIKLRQIVNAALESHSSPKLIG